MTDFNFLRIKWPKLAAIAADAGRLVEVSPASAIQTMQTFCEWAADIALDFYEISAQNGIAQQEKLDTLRATGHVPSDIIERFRAVMLAGGRLYRDNEDVEEARACIEDVYEIGRWLNKEADRAGWPPRNDYYRTTITPLGKPGDGGGFSAGRIGQAVSNFRPLIVFGVVAVLVIVAAVWGVSAILTNAKPQATAPVLTPTPTLTATPMLVTMPGDAPTATPEPETYVYLDSLTPTTTRESFFLKHWKFKNGDKPLTIGDKRYENGIGMYIPKASIGKTQGTWTMKFSLNDTYNKLRFDLGVDTMQYGTGYGKFRIQIYSNSDKDDPIYDSGLKEYNFTDLGQELSIDGCETLIIKLTEQKGSKGTINVVLGDIRLVKGGGSGTGTPDPNATGTAGASLNPGDTSGADWTETGSPAPSTSPNADNEGEQQPSPT